MGLLDWLSGATDTSQKSSNQVTTQQLQTDQFTKQSDTSQTVASKGTEDANRNQTSTTSTDAKQGQKTAQTAATNASSSAATSSNSTGTTTGKTSESGTSSTTGASNTTFAKSTLDEASLAVLQQALASAGSDPNAFNLLLQNDTNANNLIDFSQFLADRSASAETTVGNKVAADLALSKNSFENETLPGVARFMENVGSRNNSDSLSALTKANTDFAVKQDAIRTQGALEARTLADQETSQAFSALLQSSQFKEALSVDATKALTMLGDALKGATEVGQTGTTSSSTTTSSQTSDTSSTQSQQAKSVTDQISKQIQDLIGSTDTTSSSTTKASLQDILSQITTALTNTTGLEVQQGEEAAGQNGTQYSYGEQSGKQSGNLPQLLSSFSK